MTVTLTIGRIYEKLEGLGRELKAYFAGPLESITVEGVLEILGTPPGDRRAAGVRQAHDQPDAAQAHRPRREDRPEVAAAGADVDVTAEHSASRTWLWPAANEIVELASDQAKPVTQVLEPEKKPDKGKKPKYGGPKKTAWGPLRNECGTWMLTYIDPATDKEEGSEPDDWPSWWERVQAEVLGRWWIRGHLLNQKLGGPGFLKNLTPLTPDRQLEPLDAGRGPRQAGQRTRMRCSATTSSRSTRNGPKLEDNRHKNPDPSVWPNIALGLTCEWEFIKRGRHRRRAPAPITILNRHKD